MGPYHKYTLTSSSRYNYINNAKEKIKIVVIIKINNQLDCINTKNFLNKIKIK